MEEGCGSVGREEGGADGEDAELGEGGESEGECLVVLEENMT